MELLMGFPLRDKEDIDWEPIKPHEEKIHWQGLAEQDEGEDSSRANDWPGEKDEQVVVGNVSVEGSERQLGREWTELWAQTDVDWKAFFDGVLEKDPALRWDVDMARNALQGNLRGGNSLPTNKTTTAKSNKSANQGKRKGGRRKR